MDNIPKITLAIVGSRSFTNYTLLCDTMAKVKSKVTRIVSGGANGADKLAEKYADEMGIPMQLFLPQWSEYGRSAGYRRNHLICEASDCMLAFWDGESKGTAHSIRIMKEMGKPVHVVHFMNARQQEEHAKWEYESEAPLRHVESGGALEDHYHNRSLMTDPPESF